jgi:hypothetical protein
MSMSVTSVLEERVRDEGDREGGRDEGGALERALRPPRNASEAKLLGGGKGQGRQQARGTRSRMSCVRDRLGQGNREVSVVRTRERRGSLPLRTGR